jgi:hypothetical protein
MLPSFPSSGKWIGPHSTLPDSQTTGAALAAYNNRYVAVPIVTNVLERWESEGDPNQIFKEQEYQAMFAAVGIRRLISNAVLNGLGTNAPDGLVGQILEKLAPASQTKVVGNVNKATKAWWRNQYVELTSSFGTIAAGSTIPAGILAMLQVLDAGTVGQRVPTDVVVTQACFRLFRRAMLEMYSGYQIVSQKSDMNFGFKTLDFDGVTLGWDPQMPADTVIAIHMGKEKKDDRRSGDNTTELDQDIEDATTSNLLDLRGDVFGIFNPNVRMRPLQGRRPYRELNEVEWLIESFNVGVSRMSDQVIAGSTGSFWETW